MHDQEQRACMESSASDWSCFNPSIKISETRQTYNKHITQNMISCTQWKRFRIKNKVSIFFFKCILIVIRIVFSYAIQK